MQTASSNTTTRTKIKNGRKRKANIPKALREQVWIKTCGERFSRPCYISWCANTISVFDFHVGHDKPESKGGTLSIDNLKPICARCNLSMGSKYTIAEWDALNDKKYVSGSCCCMFY